MWIMTVLRKFVSFDMSIMIHKNRLVLNNVQLPSINKSIIWIKYFIHYKYNITPSSKTIVLVLCDDPLKLYGLLTLLLFWPLIQFPIKFSKILQYVLYWDVYRYVSHTHTTRWTPNNNPIEFIARLYTLVSTE